MAGPAHPPGRVTPRTSSLTADLILG